MKSFTYLNSLGQRQLTVTDQRSGTVIFNKQYPLTPGDKVLRISSNSVVVSPTIEITEIINYEIANCRYQVSIVPGVGNNKLPTSTISWGSLPTGVTLQQTSSGDIQIYTLYGISNVNLWNLIKNFTWTLPNNYANYPIWYLEISVLYYDEKATTNLSKTWRAYDDRFYYVAELKSKFTQEISVTKIKKVTANLNSRFQLSLAKEGVANLSSNFTLTADAEKAVLLELRSNFTMFTSGRLKIISRNYKENQKQWLFINVDSLIDDNTSNASYEITVTCNIGKFTSSYLGPTEVGSVIPIDNTVIFSGNKVDVNGFFQTLIFYPNKNISSNSTLNYTVTKNGSAFLSETINMYGIDSVYPGNFYILSSNSNSDSQVQFQPTWQDVYYGGKADVFLVGGGGGGGPGIYGTGSGGGGGGIKIIRNQTIAYNANNGAGYTAIIGAGGLGSTSALDQLARVPYNQSGGAGGNTTIFGITATGGTGGSFIQQASNNTITSRTNRGGTSGLLTWTDGNLSTPKTGNATTNSGGIGGTTNTSAPTPIRRSSGGGGAGAASVGQDGYQDPANTFWGIGGDGGDGTTPEELFSTFSTGLPSPVFLTTTYKEAMVNKFPDIFPYTSRVGPFGCGGGGAADGGGNSASGANPGTPGLGGKSSFDVGPYNFIRSGGRGGFTGATLVEGQSYYSFDGEDAIQNTGSGGGGCAGSITDGAKGGNGANGIIIIWVHS